MNLVQYKLIQEYFQWTQVSAETKEKLKAFIAIQEGKDFTFDQLSIVHKVIYDAALENAYCNYPESFSLIEYVELFSQKLEAEAKEIKQLEHTLIENGIDLVAIRLELETEIQKAAENLPF